MNFLQICQRLLQETGIADSGLTQVTGQTGDNQRLVDWANEAWVRIQSSRSDWMWMWGQGTASITTGSSSYTLPATVESVAYATLDDSILTKMEYRDFRDLYRTLTVSKPTAYSIRPDGLMLFNTELPSDMTLNYEFYNRPAYMVTNTDVPAMPDRFHMLIVWAALQEYAMYDEAPELAQKAQFNYNNVYAELVLDQSPSMALPGSLA